MGARGLIRATYSPLLQGEFQYHSGNKKVPEITFFTATVLLYPLQAKARADIYRPINLAPEPYLPCPSFRLMPALALSQSLPYPSPLPGPWIPCLSFVRLYRSIMADRDL